MDIRAFGSVFPQQVSLPYASGFVWAPADGEKRFSTCRGLYIEGDATDNFYIELNDAPGQWILAEVGANRVLPFAATAISGGNVDSVKVLY
jgi:hypothetical protein